MKKLLLPVMTLAMFILPAAAHAEQCRATDTGKFAKCGTPGAVPVSQYVAKGKTAPKTMAHSMSAPAATTAKPSFMSMLKPKAKATPATVTAAAVPVTKPTKGVRCKSATGKFVKCGTPGAITI